MLIVFSFSLLASNRLDVHVVVKNETNLRRKNGKKREEITYLFVCFSDWSSIHSSFHSLCLPNQTNQERVGWFSRSLSPSWSIVEKAIGRNDKESVVFRSNFSLKWTSPKFVRCERCVVRIWRERFHPEKREERKETFVSASRYEDFRSRRWNSLPCPSETLESKGKTDNSITATTPRLSKCERVRDSSRECIRFHWTDDSWRKRTFDLSVSEEERNEAMRIRKRTIFIPLLACLFKLLDCLSFPSFPANVTLGCVYCFSQSRHMWWRIKASSGLHSLSTGSFWHERRNLTTTTRGDRKGQTVFVQSSYSIFVQ